MKQVIKGGILAIIVLCFYEAVSFVFAAL